MFKGKTMNTQDTTNDKYTLEMKKMALNCFLSEESYNHYKELVYAIKEISKSLKKIERKLK